MIRTNKNITFNEGRFKQRSAVILGRIDSIEFRDNFDILSWSGRYFYKLGNNEIHWSSFAYSLKKDEYTIYFEKFSSDKLTFIEVLQDMLYYLLIDLTVIDPEFLEANIKTGDLEVFYDGTEGK